MKREIAEAWVKDLREHPDNQTTGKLYDGKDGYCCLGRLALVMGKTFGYDDNQSEYVIVGTSSYGVLPPPVYEEAGFCGLDGAGRLPPEAYVEHPTERGEKLRTLAELNDAGCYTFAEIAGVIEKHWEKI